MTSFIQVQKFFPLEMLYELRISNVTNLRSIDLLSYGP